MDAKNVKQQIDEPVLSILSPSKLYKEDNSNSEGTFDEELVDE
jgi:hypothetical protein